MERIISPEEKIRRAEEIYYRRRSKQINNRSSVARVNVSEEKDYGLFKKLILQILICLVIYFIFYLIQNGNYLFSEGVINKTREVLSYDINISEAYEQVKQFIQTNNNNNNGNTQETEEQNEGVNKDNLQHEEENQDTQQQGEQNKTENEEENQVEGQGENKTEEQKQEEQQNEEQQTNQDNQEGENVAAIGGAGFEDAILVEPKTQEQIDIEHLQKISWTKPINGTVTSEFGQRESTSSIISPNHTGIDIGANTGTIINSAIEGTVEISSTYGEYGYHIKITNGDISTLYAHCSKLYVNVGDYIQKGQAIAEVGSTGNSTGPHLHFEVIREGRYINPRSVIEF